MAWQELHIHSSADQAEILEAALSGCGALSVTLEDNADQPILEPALGETPLWCDTRVVGLFDAGVDTAAVEQQLNLPAYVRFHWQAVEDKDWEREWMKDFAPIHCGNNLWICPSWREPPVPDALNIRLDPGLAFGTGTHPTTFLCLQWLSRQSLNGSRVIDYGCGSGILGVAALKLGAARVQGIDIDPQALLATRDNVENNGLSAISFPVALPEQADMEAVEVLLANILAGPLIDLAERLAGLVVPGGLLCLSGILENQAAAVMRTYETWFDFNKPAVHEGWVRLSARKFTKGRDANARATTERGGILPSSG